MAKKIKKSSIQETELIESIKIAEGELEDLKLLYQEITDYIEKLGYMFHTLEGTRYYITRYTKKDFNQAFKKAKDLFRRIKVLEKIQNLETKELKTLLKDMKKGHYGDFCKDITDDIKIQKKMDVETQIMEDFYKNMLSYFKLILLKPEKLKDEFQGKTFIFHFFKTACYTIIQEMNQSIKEIRQLKSELKNVRNFPSSL